MLAGEGLTTRQSCSSSPELSSGEPPLDWAEGLQVAVGT